MDMPQPNSPLPPPHPGSPLPPPSPPKTLKATLNDFFAKLQGDASGFWSVVVVLGAGIILAYILWEPFAQPAKLINDALPDKNCVNELPGTSGMRSCAAGVAAFKMIGPICVGVIVFLLRGRLAKLVARVSKNLHPGARPLIAPTLATLLFLLVWAGSHARTGGQTGIVPQKAFPAIVGVYTFMVVRYSPTLQRKMVRFFTKRDRVPIVVRIIVTVAVPTAVSLLITNQDRVSNTAQKEQFVLLIGLVLAYLMISPKSGDVASAAPKALAVPPPPTGSPS
jgi:hypothetical protein